MLTKGTFNNSIEPTLITISTSSAPSSIACLVSKALGAFLVGSFALNRPLMVALGTALILGYLICTAVLGAGIRDKTPERDVGLFQGVRMIFVVLLPMVTGPLISQALFPTAEFDPNNPTLAGKQPSPVMFLVTLGFFLLSAVPMLFLRQVQKKNPPEVKE